jgi:hypothetical protein
MVDPALAPVLEKAFGREGDVTIAEYRQVRSLVIVLVSDFLEAYQQHRDGLLSDPDFEGIQQTFRMFMSFPRMRVCWQMARSVGDPAFTRLVDDLIAGVALVSPEATLAQFNQAVSAEIAARPAATPEEWAEFVRRGGMSIGPASHVRGGA